MNDVRVEVFYDGDCPLCMREIRMLRRLDRRGRIRFTDIAAPGFDAGAYGKTQAELMARIQARALDGGAPGGWIEGVEVFRALYTAVGAGPLVWLTRLPGVRWLLDAAYAVFADNRLRWTGRDVCDAGACELNPRAGDGALPG